MARSKRGSKKSEPTTSRFSVEPVFQAFFSAERKLNGLGYEVMQTRKGEVLKFQRHNQNGFYFVLQGLLKLEFCQPTPRILRLCKAGDLVGFGNWFTGHAEAYQMTALDEGRVQFWTTQAFEQLKENFPKVNELVNEHLVKIILHKDERIAALESSSVESRVGYLLVWLSQNFGLKIDDGTLIDVQLERTAMAELAGTVPETLARVLTIFEEQGLVRRHRRKIVLLDIAALKRRVNK